MAREYKEKDLESRGFEEVEYNVDIRDLSRTVRGYESTNFEDNFEYFLQKNENSRNHYNLWARVIPDNEIKSYDPIAKKIRARAKKREKFQRERRIREEEKRRFSSPETSDKEKEERILKNLKERKFKSP